MFFIIIHANAYKTTVITLTTITIMMMTMIAILMIMIINKKSMSEE